MAVMSATLPNGKAKVVAMLEAAEGLAVDDEFAYVGAGPRLFRVPLQGGAAQEMATGYERLALVAGTEKWVYFADFYRGTIARAAK